MKLTKEKLYLLIYDLYWLRYEKEGQGWHELTDYLRDKLIEDGFEIQYLDKCKDIRFRLPWIGQEEPTSREQRSVRLDILKEKLSDLEKALLLNGYQTLDEATKDLKFNGK